MVQNGQESFEESSFVDQGTKSSLRAAFKTIFNNQTEENNSA